MKLFGYHGPLEQWQHELRAVSRSGLIDLVEQFVSSLQFFGYYREHGPQLLEMVRDAKKHGKWVDNHNAVRRLLDDPEEIGRRIRKSEAAKKAARRRKRERRTA